MLQLLKIFSVLWHVFEYQKHQKIGFPLLHFHFFEKFESHKVPNLATMADRQTLQIIC